MTYKPRKDEDGWDATGLELTFEPISSRIQRITRSFNWVIGIHLFLRFQSQKIVTTIIQVFSQSFVHEICCKDCGIQRVLRLSSGHSAFLHDDDHASLQRDLQPIFLNKAADCLVILTSLFLGAASWWWHWLTWLW